jgi:ABC-type proline/glycine betaine transport system permease subunit
MYMKNLIHKIIAPSIALFILLIPVFITHIANSAESGGAWYRNGLVFCVGVDSRDIGDTRKVCNFREFINTINTLIRFAILAVAPIAVGLFTYAGFLIMSGNESEITKGKDFFWRVVYGLFFMLASGAIVKTILYLLTDPDKGFDYTSVIQ